MNSLDAFFEEALILMISHESLFHTLISQFRNWQDNYSKFAYQ